ncbi:uncharacterized protein LOC130641990 [Hydractinia symbiolongicarpus]|uniref:uncharacterized protein LOC130641990 n=1 Tax=Hydractinia symbiolongicarpus TaxID=13093 RepID=UPI002550F034|nr:uncharacterized protein LOC130641990 [Hydractinia symbiolongicarpus]
MYKWYFISLIFIAFLNLCSSSDAATNASALSIVYWEVKPYLFLNDNKVHDGIIPRILDATKFFCRPLKWDFFKYKFQATSRKRFFDLASANSTYLQDERSGFREDRTAWLPLFVHSEFLNHMLIEKKHLEATELLKSSEIAVIISQNRLVLTAKFLHGLADCQNIIIISCLFSIVFGILIWLIEQFYNPEFGKSFIKGSSTGIWWSFVTMTTVGYGDIVPHSTVGRIIGIVWMLFGVAMACVITATVTDSITGTSYFDIYQQKVSALRYSAEALIAESDYQAVVKQADSFDEVLQLVRAGEVSAAFINIDFVAWFQQEMRDHKHPLHVVYTVEKIVPLNVLLPKSLKVTQELKKCWSEDKLKNALFDIPASKFRRYCKKTTVFYGSLSSLLTDDTTVQVLAAITAGMILIGLLYEGVKTWLRRSKEKTEKDAEKIETGVDLKSMTTLLHNSVFGLRNDIELLRKEVRVVKDSVVY